MRAVDWLAMIRYGVIFFMLEKLGAAGVRQPPHLRRHAGRVVEDFQKTRKNAVLSLRGRHAQSQGRFGETSSED